MKTITLAAVAALMVPPVTARAQDRSADAAPGRAAIAGVVLDSLHGGFLRGADVMITGVSRPIRTDSIGRFFARDLPAGTYQVGIFHPLLDTLRVSLATTPFPLARDSSVAVIMSVPSAPTLIRRNCTGRPAALGTSAIVGRVVDPQTLEPVQRAEVSVAWVQYSASKQSGLVSTPHVLRDSTDASGSYAICGVPSSLEATLQAKRGAVSTAEIPITLGESPSELFGRTLLLSKSDSAIRIGSASITGRVTVSGVGQAGTRVEIAGTELVTTTNEKGDYRLDRVPGGSHLLNVRRLGFVSTAIPVDVAVGDSKAVNVDMKKFVAVMDPVVVTARRTRALDQVGFNERRRSGTGRYLAREDFERSNPSYLHDILSRVSGLRINYETGRPIIEGSRGSGGLNKSGCVTYWVDDVLWHSEKPGDINDFISAHEVMGVEVYSTLGVPTRYLMGFRQTCTTVVIWTRARVRE